MDFSRQSNGSEILILTRLASTMPPPQQAFDSAIDQLLDFVRAWEIFNEKIKFKILPRNENK